jgi:hypothetical protein
VQKSSRPCEKNYEPRFAFQIAFTCVSSYSSVSFDAPRAGVKIKPPAAARVHLKDNVYEPAAIAAAKAKDRQNAHCFSLSRRIEYCFGQWCARIRTRPPLYS